jgi:hypothetical protein
MKYTDILEPVIQILKEANGAFQTPYQICFRLQEREPALWARLADEYRSAEEDISMGAGTGTHYSPASFVSHALEYHSGENPRIQRADFACAGVTFRDVKPADTDTVVSIWSIRN